MQSQSLEIDLELYNKLLRCGIFRASPKVKTLHDKKKVTLDNDTTLLFENGIALGKYLIVLKELLVMNWTSETVSNNQCREKTTKTGASTLKKGSN